MKKILLVVPTLMVFWSSVAFATTPEGWTQVDSKDAGEIWLVQPGWSLKAKSLEGSAPEGRKIVSGSVRLLTPHGELIRAEAAVLDGTRISFDSPTKYFADGWAIQAKRIEVDTASGQVSLIGLGVMPTE